MRLRSTFLAVVLPFAIAAPAGAESAVSPDLVAKVRPHRAIYSLKAKTVEPGSGVADADGAIAYELREECGRWLTKHTFILHIVRNDARERTVRTDYTSWETKDGLSFGYETKTTTDGRPGEIKSGRATLDRIGGPGKAIVESKDASGEVALPAGTDFPTWHVLELIAAARAGKKTAWRHMFDGSNGGKVNGVFAVFAETVPASSIQPAALFSYPALRMNLSFFDPPGEGKDRPSYKVDMTVNEASVTTAMTLLYGDFSLVSKIEKIEPMPRPSCP
ncbi:MAG: DUF1849 family protein [Rhodospirillaceae bacterium]|nr:DUF1849 family protein [Rhodospirillaceae bacterium]